MRDDEVRIIADKYRAVAERLDEATLRLWAAAEARALGRGGVSLVARAVGMSRTTIYAGLHELEQAAAVVPPPAPRARSSAGAGSGPKKGAGAKS
jgi:hypothetical protein